MAKKILVDAVRHVPVASGCSCHQALTNAILTNKQHWPAKTRAELRPLLAKYL
jgi:hypothetical protein